MGLDYALVHAKFTIPLAGFLTVAAKPFLSRVDATRILFLTTVAVTATIPWDSYLIRTGVWTYPEDGVLGYSLFSIPVEELFFFVIQTYITSLIYILCSKPVLHAQYLDTSSTRPAWIRNAHYLGQALLIALTGFGGFLIHSGGDGTYLGLILAWACPFLLITWSLTGPMLLALPWQATALPILAPTLYLWFVDELSLRQGIWTIEGGTKLGSQLFGSLDMEEAIFFLITNTLIVFGIAAFDKAVAVCDVMPEVFPEPADSLPIVSLLKARVLPSSAYDMDRIAGIKEAVTRLQKKSRSFFIASSVFPGRLRIDLTLLYASLAR
jgi:15-cis-phytoene synthase/lycopene beta-cyclase